MSWQAPPMLTWSVVPTPHHVSSIMCSMVECALGSDDIDHNGDYCHFHVDTLGQLTPSPYSSAKALIMKLIRKKARWTGDPGSSISNSRPAGKFALWAPKPPPRLLPPPSLPPGKVVRAEARKEIKYILSAGPFVQK